MSFYDCINASLIGASHTRRGTPCQDYSVCLQKPGYAIAAVCDGHGAEPYFRSGRGAELAATVAVMTAEEFILRGVPMTAEEDVNRQLSQLEKCIISRWGDEVYEDFLERPYSDEEIAKLPPDWGFEDSVYSVYGTTLLLAAVTEKFWFGLQIGDGRTVELTAAGDWREPVPWDDNCFLNATTSICDENAADEFRHFFSETLPAAVFLCTDGVSESYRDENDFHNVLRGAGRVLALQSKSKARKVLTKTLPVISEGGSGDDVSLAAVFSKEKLAEIESTVL